MQIEETNCVHRLEAGQLWKLEHGYLQITEMGRRHVYYKMLRQPEQKAALTRMISIEGMLRFLQSEAVPVARPPVPSESSIAATPASGPEPVHPAAQPQENGLTLGLLGKSLDFENSAGRFRPQVASALSCLCSRSVSRMENLLGQARHPA